MRVRGWLGLLALALVMVMAFAGCGGSAPEHFTAASTTPTATAIPTLAPPTAMPNYPVRSVTFTTSDGLRLDGTLYGRGATGVALSHQSNGTQAQWAGFAQELAAQGYMALAFDFRGRGGSAGPADTSKEDIDLRAAISFLRAQGATRIALMGASLGGAVTLRVAATESAAAVVTLSAVAWWTTQPVTDATIRAIKVPKFFVNSELDPDASSTQHMYAVATPPKQLQIYTGMAHGVAILTSSHGDDITRQILAFMGAYAPAR